MRQGDLVTRQSYGEDVIFRIQEISAQQALLKGIEFRLLADAPLYDLRTVPLDGVASYQQTVQAKIVETTRQITQLRKIQHDKYHHRMQDHNKAVHSYFEVPGKVLHLDGDSMYLQKSIRLYEELRVPAEGYYVHESSMAEVLKRILPQVKPDIVVLTGHDGILKDSNDFNMHSLHSYKNSHNFVNAVLVARQYERNRDNMVIIAGACQSYFEALLQAGANFASSPARVLIHALDPLFIAAKVSFTSIKETVQVMDVIQHTYSGLEGLGGMETRGLHRIGLPGLSKALTGNL